VPGRGAINRRRCGITAVAIIVAVVTFPAATPGQNHDEGPPGVLLSRQLMESRQLRIGDVVRLAADPAGTRSQLFRIAGIYDPTPDPMRFAQQRLEARLHLPDLLELTSSTPGLAASATISAINVALVNPSDAEAFARDVSARLPGTVSRPTSAPNARTSTFLVIERFHLAVAIVTMIGSAVFLLALMMMLVDERRETVGTLRLIGLTRRRILTQVFVEGALIAGAGTAAGILFALGMQGAFNRFFQWRYDTSLVFVRITPGVVAQSVLLALPLGIAASLIASWTLLRRHPLALIRR
jgi:ABC-type lipoprotein release transport system permease subunit